MTNLLKCDHCGAQTNPNDPGAGWRVVESLYRLIYSRRPEDPKHFCSDQCQVNHILKRSDQPIVIDPKALRS